MRIDTIHIVLGIVVALLVLFVIYLLTRDTRSHYTPSEEKPKPPSPPKTDEKSPTLVLFHGDWCGHCQKMMPAWKECVKALQEKTQGKIKTLELESKNPEVAKHQIKGFPTVRYYPQGFPDSPMIEYQGDRSASSLINFALSGGGK